MQIQHHACHGDLIRPFEKGLTKYPCVQGQCFQKFIAAQLRKESILKIVTPRFTNYLHAYKL